MSVSRPASSFTFSDNFNNFNRSNFYLYCPSISKEELEAAKKIVAEKGENYPFFAQQLGIYYSFHKRQKAPAEEYFNILLDAARETMQAVPTDKNKLAYATALSFVAHADSIDGGFRSKPLEQYMEVLTVLDKISNKMDPEGWVLVLEIETLRGFTLRYTAMMHHRKNFDSTPEEKIACFAHAGSYIRQALSTQEEILLILTEEKADEQKLSAINADIAESHHIQGVIFTVQGKTAKAMAALQAAKTYWMETLRKEHPFQFITEQSLGNLYREGIAHDAKAHEKAEKCLLTALRGHEHYFRMIVNADIGKTMHFLGQLYEDMKLYALSRFYYKHSLDIKTELKSDASIVDVTNKGLLRINRPTLSLSMAEGELVRIKEELKKYPKFDWNLPETFPAYKAHLPAHIVNVNAIAHLMPYLDPQEAAAANERILELGTYYNHLARDPEAALRYLVLNPGGADAHTFLWSDLHIAFSYQQLLAAANKANIGWEKDYFQRQAKEIYIANTWHLPIVTAEAFKQVKSFAFAWCLKALTEYELVDIKALQTGDAVALADLKQSADSYKVAIDMYERFDLRDNQYARAKNRYAQILALSPTPVPGHLQPLELFVSLETFWKQHADGTNPYPARFYVSYADFLIENKTIGTFKVERALEKYNRAVELLENDPQHLKYMTAIELAKSDPANERHINVVDEAVLSDARNHARFIADIKDKIKEAQKLVPRLSPRLLAANADSKEEETVSAAVENLSIDELHYTQPAP